MRRIEITALLVSPNKELSAQLFDFIGKSRAFQIVGELKSYPSEQTLDMRLRQFRPDVVLVDVATDLDVACDLLRYLAALTPAVPGIAIHATNESAAILKSLRAGASEFLYAPFEVSIQEAVIARIQKLIVTDTGIQADNGKVIVFSSAKPGSGASTLAMQSALAVHRATRKRVLLADLDLLGGSIGFYMNLEQTHSITDVLQRADKLDAHALPAAAIPACGIDVLPAPETPYAEPVESSRVHDLLQCARLSYDFVILDVPSVFHRMSLSCLSESDKAFLVTTSELASLHLARKAVKLLAHVGFDSSRFQVIVNRLDKRDAMSGTDLSKLFDCRIDATLPSDFFGVHRGLARGEPLEADSELGKAIDGLASKLRLSTQGWGRLTAEGTGA